MLQDWNRYTKTMPNLDVMIEHWERHLKWALRDVEKYTEVLGRLTLANSGQLPLFGAEAEVIPLPVNTEEPANIIA